jgi:HAD superfamily hydrolase (TIGR01509 family)
MTQPILAVAFDLDGLMINTEELYRESGSRVLQRRGRSPRAGVFQAMMGRPNPDALQVMIDAYQLTDSIDQLRHETDVEMRQLIAERLAPMPGLITLLEDLGRARIPKAVTTSATKAYLDIVCERLTLAHHFQFALTAEDVSRGKPDPEIYVKAAERFGVHPAALVVLEDSVNGCRAALAAGARTVAVPSVHTGPFHEPVELIAADLCDPRLYRLLGLV